MREKFLMNRDWRFYFGTPDYKKEKFTSFDQHYRASRGESARGAGRRDYDDSDWRIVNLPHDFVYEQGNVLPECVQPVGGDVAGFPLDRGEGWYRRYFKLDEADKNKEIILHFEAVATRCDIYVNSVLMKKNETAGIGFDVDITAIARFGYEYNVVSVRADCHDFETWYYEGGGITRNVWLIKKDRLSVDLWGTFVKTKCLDYGKNEWKLDIETEVVNNYYEDKTATIVSEIFDNEGKLIAKTSSEETFELADKKTIYQSVTVENPKVWDTEHCNMNRLVTSIIFDGIKIDEYETNFGIREFRYDADNGLFLNEKPTKIYGFSNHTLYLGVGNAMSDSMREFQMRTIRDMGGNGFRTVHSPHGEATYEAADKYGILIMDENRVFHPSDIRIDEVERMIKRDRNHPSVCMWSLYNEEDSVTREAGKRTYKLLAEKARKLDNTRPMTGATSYGIFTEHAHDEYDIIGVNHQTMNFSALRKQKPGKAIFCSESVSPLGMEPYHGENSRIGEDLYQFEKDYVVGGFHFTAWEFTPDVAVIMNEKFNDTRIIDGIGGKGPCYYGYRAFRMRNVPIAKISPAWDYPGREGKEITMYLPNNGDYVEVYVNGKFRDKVETNYYTATQYVTTYEPGEMKIIAYKDGKVWAEDSSKTSTKPCKIKLDMENEVLKADNDDVAIITAYLVDENGTLCKHSRGTLAHFSCNEAGEFVSSTSLRKDGYQKYGTEDIRFFNGKCQVFYRSMKSDNDLVISVSAEGFETETITIKRVLSDLKHYPSVNRNFISDWQISKLYPFSMDDEEIMREHEIERWEHIDIMGSPDILDGAIPDRLSGLGGAYPLGTSLNYAYHAYTKVPNLGVKPEGHKLGIYFEGLDGEANIYITNGKKTVTAKHPSDSPWFGHYRPEMKIVCDEFEPGEELEIWIMMHNAGRVTGIGWPVSFIYTTQKDADELNERMLREWNASTLNDD